MVSHRYARAMALAMAAILLLVPYRSFAQRSDRVQIGTLGFERCEIGRTGVGGIGTVAAWCTLFEVPEDWHTPQGRHIQLRVAILRSTSTRRQSDLVTFLDGGPGGAATEDFPAVASAFAPLRERHDVLLVDQRGTGGSQPLDCPGQQEQENGNTSSDTNADLIGHCLQTVQANADPKLYTTSIAVQDLEAVRQALGAPQLNLIGVSYGTRVAQQYAVRYPSAVRSVVLDSAVPNELILGSDFGRSLDQSLRSLFALCTADATCQQRFGDSYATLFRLRDRLRAHPQTVTVNDPASFRTEQLKMDAEDLVGIVRLYAYSPLTAALLPLMLHEADSGNYAPLLSQKRLLSDTLGAELSGGMPLSVVCSEDADLLQPQPLEAQTLMGSSELARIQRVCRIWPHGTRPDDFHQPWHGEVPVLLLAGQFDPVTPPEYGRQILANLSHARLLVAAGQGHSVMTAGCMPRLIRQFMDGLQPQAIDAHCLEQLGTTPAFVSFNGASP
jgi:pimeloyl-ACP methyl ester carboxylesterase